MEREVGGGIGMGNTCKPMAVSFQCMTKTTTIKKKKEATPEPAGHNYRTQAPQQGLGAATKTGCRQINEKTS